MGKSFILLAIKDAFSITGHGTIATSCHKRGSIRAREIMDVVGLKETRNSIVTGVEMFQKNLDKAMVGILWVFSL